MSTNGIGKGSFQAKAKEATSGIEDKLLNDTAGGKKLTKELISGLLDTFKSSARSLSTYLNKQGESLREALKKKISKSEKITDKSKRMSLFTRNLGQPSYEEEVAIDEASASALDDGGKYKTSGTEPPDNKIHVEDSKESQTTLITSNLNSKEKDNSRSTVAVERSKMEMLKEAIKEGNRSLIKEMLYGTGKVSEKEKKKGFLGTLKDSLSDLTTPKETRASIWDKFKNKRMSDRANEVQAEKDKLAERGKPKKKGWLGKIFWVATGLLKGLWWGTKKFFGTFAKNLFRDIGFVFRAITGGFKLIGSMIGGVTRGLIGLGKFLINRGFIPLMGFMGRHLGKLGSKLAGVLNKTKWGSKIVGGAKAIGGFGSKIMGSGVMKWAGRALRWGAKAAGVVGRGLLLASGPIGWAITIGLMAWDAYDLYKSLSSNGDFPDNTAGKITKLRLMSYGINDDQKQFYKDILQLEEAAGPWFKFDPVKGTVQFVKPTEEGTKNIHVALGVDQGIAEMKERKFKWFNDRFVPAYGAFLKSLWGIEMQLSPGKIDKLDRGQLAKLVYNFDVPKNVFELRDLPFNYFPRSSVSMTEYDTLLSNLQVELKEDFDKASPASITNPVKMEAEAKKNLAANLNKMQKKYQDSYKGNDLTKYFDKSGINGEIPEVGSAGERMGGYRVSTMYGGDSTANNGYGENLSRSGVDFSGGGKYKDTIMNNASGHANQNLAKINIPSGSVSHTPSEIMKAGKNVDISNLNGRSMSLPDIINVASMTTGIPPEYLWTNGKLESDLDMDARNPAGATGINQFVPLTWNEEMRPKYFAKYGIPNNAQPTDPLYSMIMAGAYMKANIPYVEPYYEQAGLDLGEALYLAHFFGPSGAKTILQAYIANPNADVRVGLSKKGYQNNSHLHGMTVAQAVDETLRRYREKSKIPAESMAGYKKHKAMNPEAYKGTGKLNDIVKDVPKLNMPKHSATDVFNYDGSDTSAALTGRKSVTQTDMTDKIGNFLTEKGYGDLVDQFQNEQTVIKNNEAMIDRMTSGQGINSGGDPMVAHDVSQYTGRTTAGNVIPRDAHSSAQGSNSNFDYERYGEDIDNIRPNIEEGGGPVVTHPIMVGYKYAYGDLCGPRKSSQAGASPNHKGIDFKAGNKRAGIPIVATGDGRVTMANFQQGYGNVVYILHKDGKTYTKYAHLKGFNVRPGQEVKAGDKIGEMGNTQTGIPGMGVHLHFEVRGGLGKTAPVIDPMTFPAIKKAYKGQNVYVVNEPAGNVKELGEETPNKQDENNLPPEEFLTDEEGGDKGNPKDPTGGNPPPEDPNRIQFGRDGQGLDPNIALNQDSGELDSEGPSSTDQSSLNEITSDMSKTLKGKGSELTSMIDKFKNGGKDYLKKAGFNVKDEADQLVKVDNAGIESLLKQVVEQLGISVDHLGNMDKDLANNISKGVGESLDSNIGKMTESISSMGNNITNNITTNNNEVAKSIRDVGTKMTGIDLSKGRFT